LLAEEEKQGNLEKQRNLRNLRKEEDYKIYEKCIKNIYTYYIIR
jgi:hypothetical protein